jgi:tRNA C32,U32 (ribose-2'-O)-methylase TrmJ
MAETQMTDRFAFLNGKTNAELRTELKQHGLPTSGNKKDLVARLRHVFERTTTAKNETDVPLHLDTCQDEHVERVNRLVN